MKKAVLMIVVACWFAVMAQAQKTCVIASFEDHIPLREALIHTNNNHWARTDYRGYWTMKYQFDSATVSKPGYVKTTIYLKNLPDTVFLLPQSHQLGAVEVWGENMPGIKGIQKDAKRQAEIGGAEAPQGIASFDFAKMLDRRGRRDNKHLKQARKIFGEMDNKDPIVEAYEKATGRKYLMSDSLKSNVVPVDSPDRQVASPTKEKNEDKDNAGNGEKAPFVPGDSKHRKLESDAPKGLRVEVDESVTIRK